MAANRRAAFVLFSNNEATLERCLRSLRPAFDFILAVDTGASDRSTAIARDAADQVLRVQWQGFGHARAAALEELRRQDDLRWGFYLDSDEWLPPEEVTRLRAAMDRLPPGGWKVRRLNFVDTPARKYLWCVDERVRLFSPDAARWTASQLVHEAFPPGRYGQLDVSVHHDFVVSEGARLEKELLYAILWAAQNAGRRSGSPPRLAATLHFVRDVLVRGAMFRGGLHAVRLARELSAYALWKHRLLTPRGLTALAPIRELLEQGRPTDLFPAARRLAAELATTGRLPA
ncbi:MAG: glycosyltransferase family 2 protein [Myxococcota bacterium]